MKITLAALLLTLSECAPGPTPTTRQVSSGSDPYTVVMIMDGREVRRYENATTICFKVFAGHGGDSISCNDKPQ